MKFLAIILAVSAVGVLSAPAEDGDELAQVDLVMSHLQEKFRKPEEKMFGSILIRSFDKKCVYEHYKENHLLKYLTVEDVFENGLSDMNAIYTFVNVFTLCSSKLDVLSEFLFENIRTNRILYKSFIDEPSLRNFTDYIWCANKFAVQHDFIDHTVYDQKLKVAGDNDESCDELSEIINVGLSALNLALRQELNTPCVIKPFKQLQKTLFSTILKLQVDFTPEQQRHERKHFIQEIRNFLEGILKCASKPKSKIPFTDEITKKMRRF